MKNVLLMVLGSLILFPFAGKADDSQVIVSVKPSAVFTPKGFDSSDNAQVVLYGIFHDICHKVAPAQVSVDRVNHKVFIENQVYETQMCAAIYVSAPYTSVLNLGVLSEGNYEVYVSDGKGGVALMSTLPVAKAKDPTATDNYIYARVDEIQTSHVNSSVLEITLKGSFSNTCMSLKEVRTSLTKGNVYDVLPILAMSGENCKPANIPYEKKVSLANFPSNATLINVRSMGGQSIEKVIDFNDEF